MRGRILVASYAVDHSSSALATGSDLAVTLVLPDGNTSSTLPADVAKAVVFTTASADAVMIRAGGVHVGMIQPGANSLEVELLANKGTAITLRSRFGAVSSGKTYIAFYN